MQLFLFILLADVVVTAVQRRYYSSIRDIRGLFLASISIFWQIWQIAKGRTAESTIKLHEKYGMIQMLKNSQLLTPTDMLSGPFVRISHKEVSINHPDAIRTVLLAPLRKVRLYGLFLTNAILSVTELSFGFVGRVLRNRGFTRSPPPHPYV